MTRQKEILDYWAKTSSKTLTSKEIKDIEDLIQAKLPELYVDFMTRFGSAHFDIDGYSTINSKYDMNLTVVEKPVLVSYFYGYYELMQMYPIFSKPMIHYDDIGPRIPPLMLPIGAAAAVTAGQILMNVSSKNSGSIWYWERVDETWGEGDNTLLGFMGNDIFQMVNSLKKYKS